MHQLFAEKLHSESDLGRFFGAYFGWQVLERLNSFGFMQWPNGTLAALRELRIHMAKAFPEADHVVRDDVDRRVRADGVEAGPLLLYFGISRDDPGQRRHFTCVGWRPRGFDIVLTTYIGGSANADGRERLAQEEDPKNLLEHRTIRCVNDVKALADRAVPVLKIQQRLVVERRGATPGETPASCQRDWYA